jgi:glutathione synthase/RimK-type ligase-like ATP-grasp enzyme
MCRCAFLTTDYLSGYVSDDELTIKHLHDFGWSVEMVSWHRNYDWSQFDVVVIRSTWDYQRDPDAFLAVLESIDHSNAHLENSLELVQWNLRKTYLRDIALKGGLIIPTLWQEETLDRKKLESFFDELETEELIIKPIIGASAGYTFRLPRSQSNVKIPMLEKIFNRRAYIVQPFMPNIVEEGEFSLIYFEGMHSHTILKTPKTNDFRVQEEYGGNIHLVKAEPELLQSGQHVINSLPQRPLYARADFIRTEQGTFAVMELELIEPVLYFRMDADSPMLFAHALTTRLCC